MLRNRPALRVEPNGEALSIGRVASPLTQVICFRAETDCEMIFLPVDQASFRQPFEQVFSQPMLRGGSDLSRQVVDELLRVDEFVRIVRMLYVRSPEVPSVDQ